MGTVFFDLVFSDLSGPPRPGTEVRTSSLNISPGGIANIAVAFARLGLKVSLCSSFSSDAFGQYLVSTLSNEGIDLSTSQVVEDWTTPVTVSMASGADRSLVTHQQEVPGGEAVSPEVRADAVVVSLESADLDWLGRMRRTGALVLADVGWDHEEQWSGEHLERLSHVDVFLPNTAEALAYTRRESVDSAARELGRLVPLVVIKRGSSGSLAYRRSDDTLVSEEGLIVRACDSTGAGDVFDAGFLYAILAGWRLEHCLRFANLCAAESVCLPGSALSAPCWRDLRAWWGGVEAPEIRQRYLFLEPLWETAPERAACRRAQPSLTLEQALGVSSIRQPRDTLLVPEEGRVQ